MKYQVLELEIKVANAWEKKKILRLVVGFVLHMSRGTPEKPKLVQGAAQMCYYFYMFLLLVNVSFLFIFSSVKQSNHA